MLNRVTSRLRASKIDQWDESSPGTKALSCRGRTWVDLGKGSSDNCISSDRPEPGPKMGLASLDRSIWRSPLPTPSYGRSIIPRTGRGPPCYGMDGTRGLRRGWSSLRLDALAINPVSNRMYRHRNDIEIVRVQFRKGEAYVYERMLRPMNV